MSADRVLRSLYLQNKYLSVNQYFAFLVWFKDRYKLSEKDIYRAIKYYPKEKRKCKR